MRHPRSALGTVVVGAVVVGATVVLAGCGTPATDASPTPHPQAVEAVHVISPHLSAARIDELVPRGHYEGILAGAVTTCGTEGVNLTPAEMTRQPVEVTLWHRGSQIAAVRLSRRSGFAFLIVGGSVVHFRRNARTHEQPYGWAPSFVIRTSSGFSSQADLGGLGGTGEEVFQIPSRPHVHPCYPDKPRIPDSNLVSIEQACTDLASTLGPVSPATGEHAVMITLTNVGGSRCKLFGYPYVELRSASGSAMPFTLLDGHSLYLSDRPPRVVTLSQGARAYVVVAKYRCDLGERSEAATLRLVVPISGQVLTIARPGLDEVGTFAYCRGGRHDPGNSVSVSPVSSTARSILP